MSTAENTTFSSLTHHLQNTGNNIFNAGKNGWKVLTHSKTKNFGLIIGSIGLLIGGAVILGVFIPHILPVSVQHGWNLNNTMWVVSLTNKAALVKTAAAIAIGSAAIGAGIGVLHSQMGKFKKVLKNAIDHKLEEKIEASEVTTLKRSMRNLLRCMQASSEVLKAIENSKVGRIIQTALIIGLIIVGAALLGVVSYYLCTLNTANLFHFVPGTRAIIDFVAFPVWPLTMKLAIAGLTLGGAAFGLGAVKALNKIYEGTKNRDIIFTGDARNNDLGLSIDTFREVTQE